MAWQQYTRKPVASKLSISCNRRCCFHQRISASSYTSATPYKTASNSLWYRHASPLHLSAPFSHLGVCKTGRIKRFVTKGVRDEEQSTLAQDQVAFSVGDVSLELVGRASDLRNVTHDDGGAALKPETDWGEEYSNGEWGSAVPAAEYAEPDTWGLAALTTIIVVAGLCAFSLTRKGHTDASTPYVKQQRNIQVVIEPPPSGPTSQPSRPPTAIISEETPASSPSLTPQTHTHPASEISTSTFDNPQASTHPTSLEAAPAPLHTKSDTFSSGAPATPIDHHLHRHPDSPHAGDRTSGPIPSDPLTALRTDPNLHASLEQLLNSPGEHSGKQLSPAEQHLMAVLSQAPVDHEEALRELALFGVHQPQQDGPWNTRTSWDGSQKEPDTRPAVTREQQGTTTTTTATEREEAPGASSTADRDKFDTAGSGSFSTSDVGSLSTSDVLFDDQRPSGVTSGSREGAATASGDGHSAVAGQASPVGDVADVSVLEPPGSSGSAAPEYPIGPSERAEPPVGSVSQFSNPAVTAEPVGNGVRPAPAPQPLWAPPWQPVGSRAEAAGLTAAGSAGLLSIGEGGQRQGQQQLGQHGIGPAPGLLGQAGEVQGERDGKVGDAGMAAAMKLRMLDAHLGSSSGLQDLQMEAEPPARAVQPHEVEALDSERTMPGLRERAQIALRAAGAASQASQRAAAYSAAASSAASKAAEAAEKAAAAATAAQAALEDAAEDSIQAAEARVALAVEAAAEAEERAASAAAVATAYQDISETQAVVATKAAYPPKQEAVPEGMVGAVHSWMTQLGEGVAAFLQPIINFFSPYVLAVTGWLLFIWNELYNITSRAVQFITRPFS